MESVLIAIVYHSGRGHTKRQAEAVKTGVAQVKGAEALLFTGEEAQTRWGDLATGNIDWQEIVLLYEGLVQIASGIGSLVGRAVALAQASDPSAGLARLEEIPADRIVNYQPYWAARGHLLELLKRCGEAQEAFTRAASLTDDPALRKYLFKRVAENR